ncbi:MAG: L,D-transpeptidase family protein, partial [Longispora sp.]|nr:L,D-transpeptidase family protein [Longispora sp. (in: high G+C Gram-positive bacteria)]
MALRRMTAGVVIAVTLTVAAMGCSSTTSELRGPESSARWQDATLKLLPTDKATDIPVSAEIEVKDGVVPAEIEVSGPAGKVAGERRSGNSSWVPAEPLAYDTVYLVRIGEQTSTFTTMSRPDNRVNARSNIGDHTEYGQAIEITLGFDNHDVPQDQRASVEKRLFVKSDPPQVGSWRWLNASRLEYRPKEYWQPNTKVDVRYALGGLPLGDGAYGAADMTSEFTIDGDRRELIVDNETKTLEAILNGEVVKSIPVSLGKPSTPSSSGTMVIMEKLEKTVFDSSTYGVPVKSPEGYRVDVQWAQRITWSGQFIHANPKSIADQGVRNVSHGCTNVSTNNGQWLFEFTK